MAALTLSLFSTTARGGALAEYAASVNSALNVLRAIPSAQHAAILDQSSTQDHYAYIAAIAADAPGRGLYFPAGRYNLSQRVSLLSNTVVFGDRHRTRVVGTPTLLGTGGLTTGEHCLFRANGATGVHVFDMIFDTSLMTNWVAGVRCLWFNNVSDYSVVDCGFKTCGAAVASIKGSDFRIRRNKVLLSATDGVAHHDGVIDQWDGCNDFDIEDNILRLGGLSPYGILATGEDTGLVGVAISDFNIRRNRVAGAKDVGIFVNGRAGTAYDFALEDNVVTDTTNYYAIGIADAHSFKANVNRTVRSGRNGMFLGSEASLGGTLSAQRGVVRGNIVRDANRIGTSNALEGAGIGVGNASADNSVDDNDVRGSAQTYGVYLGASTTGNRVRTNAVQTGSLGSVAQAGSGNTIVP